MNLEILFSKAIFFAFKQKEAHSRYECALLRFFWDWERRYWCTYSGSGTSHSAQNLTTPSINFLWCLSLSASNSISTSALSFSSSSDRGVYLLFNFIFIFLCLCVLHFLYKNFFFEKKCFFAYFIIIKNYRYPPKNIYSISLSSSLITNGGIKSISNL